MSGVVGAGPVPARVTSAELRMLRADAVAAIYPRLADDEVIVVTIMGAVAVELFQCGHRPNFFYLEHAMGLASSLGLGIALSLPHQPVVVIDGDGSLLMNLGTLSTLARYRPANLTHVVFDNESLLSVGGFPTATSTGSDLSAIARGAGITNTGTYTTVEDFASATRSAIASGEMNSLVAKVEAVGPAGFHMDLELLENRFEFARALRPESS